MTPAPGRSARAAFATLWLGRFDSLRPNGGFVDPTRPGVLFCGTAADTRAAGTEPASQQAFAFALLGLHANAEAAQRFHAERRTVAPWLAEAKESWAALLQPFRQSGESNYVDRTQPGSLFADEAIAPAPKSDTPFVSLTTSGWVVTPQLDMNRVREFGAGVLAVRASMTGMPGLHSQQSFFYPRGLEYDPMTLTIWRHLGAMSAFAYGPGVHKLKMDDQKDRNLADRTSFNRLAILHSEGTWYGSDPLVAP